jgi:hypothetical protein
MRRRDGAEPFVPKDPRIVDENRDTPKSIERRLDHRGAIRDGGTVHDSSSEAAYMTLYPTINRDNATE